MNGNLSLPFFNLIDTPNNTAILSGAHTLRSDSIRVFGWRWLWLPWMHAESGHFCVIVCEPFVKSADIRLKRHFRVRGKIWVTAVHFNHRCNSIALVTSSDARLFSMLSRRLSIALQINGVDELQRKWYGGRTSFAHFRRGSRKSTETAHHLDNDKMH